MSRVSLFCAVILLACSSAFAQCPGGACAPGGGAVSAAAPKIVKVATFPVRAGVKVVKFLVR